MPVNDFFAKNGKVLPNGRMIHDMYLFEVKKPSESKGAVGLLQAPLDHLRRAGLRDREGERLPDDAVGASSPRLP
jgi:hypothetical protein